MRIAPQIIASGLIGSLLFGAALFLPAGTLAYWQAWVFIVVFLIATPVPSGYLAVHDPAALERRFHAGRPRKRARCNASS